MAQTAVSPASWPVYVASARGFFKQEGLEIERVELPSSATQTQALLAGDLHFNVYTVDSMAKAVLSGAPLKLVASAQETPNLQLIVGSDVDSFAALRGRTLGGGTPGGYFDVILRAMLSAHGLESDDYQLLSVRDVRARIPALKTGQITASLMNSPDDLIALSEGLRSLGYVYETIPGLQYSGYLVADNWAKANEATLVGFLRASLKGLAWLRDPANKDEAKQLYGRISELPGEFQDKMYEQMVVQRMLGTDMRPNMAGIQKVLTIAVQEGGIEAVPPLDTWIDLSYLDKASGQSR